MARRRPEDQEFAADSILDVVANIVGILIILIVSAAVRVGSAPLELQSLLEPPPESKTDADASADAMARDDSATRDEAAPSTLAEKTEPTIAQATPSFSTTKPDQPVAPARPQPEVAPPRQPSPRRTTPPRQPSPELIAEYETTLARLAELESQAEATERALDAAGRQGDAVRAQLALQQERLGEASGAFEGKRRTADEIRADVETIAAQLAAARRRLEATEKSKPLAKQIKHRVTPVSRTVQGQELHFRLAEGRISVIPMEEMKERLKTQIARQREWLAKFRRHQGEIGPVQGYRMRYVVEREDSGVDDLRAGGMMRIVVSQFEVHPERDVPAETAAEALQPRSNFQRALRAASADAALTFWVYPDSFALYGALTQFAHREGFTVAARPLPEGVPIAGSPKGTRSAGQ